jgi:hypothetical protein
MIRFEGERLVVARERLFTVTEVRLHEPKIRKGCNVLPLGFQRCADVIERFDDSPLLKSKHAEQMQRIEMFRLRLDDFLIEIDGASDVALLMQDYGLRQRTRHCFPMLWHWRSASSSVRQFVTCPDRPSKARSPRNHGSSSPHACGPSKWRWLKSSTRLARNVVVAACVD